MFLFDRLLEFINKHGLIRFFVILYCLSLVYIVVYVCYVFIKFVHSIVWNGWENSPDEAIFNLPPILILDVILRYLFNMALSVVWFLTGIFLILYAIYAAARLILLHIILLAFFKIFRDCKDYRIFDLFDRIVIALFGFDTFTGKLREIILSTLDFVRNFFQEAFDVFLPGYQLNSDYIQAAIDCMSGPLTEEKKAGLMEMLAEKTPYIKINIKNDPVNDKRKLDRMDIIKTNQCFKSNMITERGDENTIDRLRIILSNTFAKQECLRDYKSFIGDIGNQLSEKSNSNIDKFGKEITFQKIIIG